MSKEVTTVSAEGYSSDNVIRDFDVEIDATGEGTPDTLEMLLASYASCFVPALRVGAEQRDAGDLGEIEIRTTGELNDDDKLDAIHFDVTVDATLEDSTADAVLERAQELCKVHDALKADLHAEIDL
jgi:uncharacterized OsmC-like protein